MREQVRNTFGFYVAAVTVLPRFLMDMFLFSILMSHIQRALAFDRYRPIYLRSGRRKRIRY